MKSKITGGETELLFTAKVLSKYDVKYYRCLETGFIQSEEPYWLAEAYSSAITKLDIGLLSRNIRMAEVAQKLIYDNFDHAKMFLDYAGGYGIFTRLMRDKGYDFYNTDIYCENIFAENLDLAQLPAGTQFELATAYEVFEHLPEPYTGIEDIFKHTKNIFFSTEIVPADLSDLKSWWYFSFETGQHVAFYTTDALKYIAEKMNCHFYTDNKSMHLFTEKELSRNPFEAEKPAYVHEPFLVKKMREKSQRWKNRNNPGIPSTPRKESLMDRDTQAAKKRLGIS